MPDTRLSALRAGPGELVAATATTGMREVTANAAPPAGSEPRNYLQCCVLLLLRERPAHGYELLERLKPFGFGCGDPGKVYRRLRSLERLGMVRSEWETSGVGPRRRIYYLTEPGDARLRGWADSLAETRRLVDYFLGRHERASAVEAHGRTR